MSNFDPAEYIRKAVQAKASQSGNFIRPGRYTLGIKNLLIKKGHKGVFFVAEHEVVKAEPGSEADGKPSSPNLVGTDCSYVTDLASESGPGNLKTYFLALLDLREGQIDDDKLNGLISEIINCDPARTKVVDGVAVKVPVQSMRGALISDTVFMKKTRKNTDFTVNNWSSVTEANGNDQKACAERRAKYGGDAIPQ